MRNFKLTTCLALVLIFLVSCLLTPATCRAQQTTFYALAYHDVVDTRDQLTSDAVTMDTLVNHFEWLLANNYHPISIDQLLQVQEGRAKLPKKAVLLCWDDGYESFYTHVFPLLKAYNFPAVLALVGNWLNTKENQLVHYGNELAPRKTFLTWGQLRILARSDLVEIASHSMHLHNGLLADQAGDKLPAVITHVYDPKQQQYETDSNMFSRIYNDLSANNQLIEKHLGRSPRVMVWPYGRYNQLALDAAAKTGMDITLTLDPVEASTNSLNAIPRIYPTLNPDTGTFKESLLQPSRPPLRRFIQVNTAQLIEGDLPREKIFASFLDRVKSLEPGRVFFEPVVQFQGMLQALFPNRTLPVLQDRLTRLTWHTNARAATEVHLRLTEPLFKNLPKNAHQKFFFDLGKSAPCSGVLLENSSLLNALLTQLQIKQPAPDPLPIWNPNITRKNRQELLQATDSSYRASSSIIHPILTALEAMQNWQPFLDVGLLVPLDLLSTTAPEHLQQLLSYFDYLMIDLSGHTADDPKLVRWFNQENTKALRPYCPVRVDVHPAAPKNSLESALTSLQQLGIMDYGYATDHFLTNQPELISIKPLISTRTFPFVPK